MSNLIKWRPRGADAFRHAYGASLPEGPVWSRDLSSGPMRFASAVGALLAAWAESVGYFLRVEAYPPSSVDLLPDWERVLGLPDSCRLNPPADLAARQAAVLLKLISRPGRADPAYFVELAESLGYSITITEYRPFMAGISRAADPFWNIAPPEMRYVWRVKIAHAALEWFRSAAGESGIDPHLQIERAIDLECFLRRLSPAHTRCIVGYDVLSITVPELPIITVGSAVSIRLSASGNAEPYEWSATGLPVGLDIDEASGEIFGNPTAVGTSLVLVTVQEAGGVISTVSLSIDVVAAGAGGGGGGGGPLSISYQSDILANSWCVGETITPIDVSVSGGVAPYTYAFATSAVPGLSVNPSSGQITGAPTVAGVYSVAIRVTDSASAVADTPAITMEVEPEMRTADIKLAWTSTIIVTVRQSTRPITLTSSSNTVTLTNAGDYRLVGVLSFTPSGMGGMGIQVTVGSTHDVFFWGDAAAASNCAINVHLPMANIPAGSVITFIPQGVAALGGVLELQKIA